MADLSSHYLTRQLIAYIGNKRRLLPSLHLLFSRLAERNPINIMLDPFAGSGSVSRLGKSMGFEVYANDWEEYSRIINSCHLAVSPEKAEGLFRRYGGLAACIRTLNQSDGPPAEPYFARYYAPEDTAQADYRRERLFYTRENALFLDRVRGWIEAEYPAHLCSGDPDKKIEKDMLIAMLLYEAATHTNTSGVFKACHKGFGGHGQDALGRIMAPMELEYPVLIGGPAAVVGSQDAREWTAGRTADLCYLDPPYNIHQYGSNYHLLNSVARWDRREVSMAIDDTGRLHNKAGIRSDWKQTRSSYCSRLTACSALKELLDAIDSRFIVLSYNSDGLISFEELMDTLVSYGRAELFAEQYTQYRGGKQGLNRKNLTTEFQLVVTRGQRHRREDTATVNRFLQIREIGMLLRNGFHPGRLAERRRCIGSALIIDDEGSISIPLIGGCLPEQPPGAASVFSALNEGVLGMLREDLHYCRFRDNHEEAATLLGRVAQEEDPRVIRVLFLRFLIVLKKLAHKKYRDVFWSVYNASREYMQENAQENTTFMRKLQEIRRVAEKRFDG